MLHTIRRFIVVTLLIPTLLVVTGCSRKRAPAPLDDGMIATPSISQAEPFKMPTRPAGEVAPGFQVQILNAEDDRVNGTFRVGFDGRLKLPYEITVNTNGLTKAQAITKIRQAYQKFFQTDPTMQITFLEDEYVLEVGGLVEKPGQYVVRKNASLDEVVAMAGGMLRSSGEGGGAAIAQYVRVQQLGTTMLLKLSDYYAGSDHLVPEWQGGDRLFFQSERGDIVTTTGVETTYVRVLGQVRNPGEYSVREGGDFFHYLIRAGGPTDRADLANVVVLRGGSTAGDNFVRFDAYNAGPLPGIRGGDVVIVQADNPSPTEKDVRFFGDIAAILGSIATIALLFITV